MDEENVPDDLQMHSNDEEETPACCNLIFLLVLGLGLAFTIIVLFLGIVALGLFVLIPIEQWAEGFGIVILIVVEIPLVLVFVTLCLGGFFIVGIINRFGVERISKTNLPKNRKWILLHGFIITIIGQILIHNIFGIISQTIEISDSYWMGIMGYMITNAIDWFGLFLVGLVGYLVAIKSPLFRDMK